MRATTGPETVRKAFEVGLVNPVEDHHHSLLDDLVFQCCDTQGALPPIGLRYVDSSRRSCPIRSAMHSTVQIGKSIFQSSFILLPRHAIDSRRGLTLECVKAIAKESGAEVVEQSGKPFLLPFSCCLPHTAQSLGQAFPALCRALV